MPIGPQLPPHLAALQKPAEDDADPAPQAGPQLPTTAAAAPTDEADSDDDYGPSLPPDLVKPAVAGPTLPPPVAGPSKPSIGPQLPPHLTGGRRSPSPPSPPSSRPVAGPSFHQPQPYGADDDSDDDFGPMPLPAGVTFEENDGARQFREREERQAEKERLEREGKGKLQREEWMLVPPKEMDLLSSMDTTKLKSRGFATGKAAAQAGKKEGPSNLWTETPAERQQRLQDEAMGKKRKAENAVVEETDDERRKRIRDRQLKEEVEKHNASARGESLVDSHIKASKKKKAEGGGEDDRAPTAIWDRDRDLGMGGRVMDDSKRSSIIKNAKGLGGRFSGGGYM